MKSTPAVGDVVCYFPVANTDPDFHDKGHSPVLPAIVTKVWENDVVNIQVFLDGPKTAVFKLCVRRGFGVGEWNWQNELLNG
jgi:hypothetical protein